METLIQPDFVMKRKICENCGEGIFEFGEDTGLDKYICLDCSAKISWPILLKHHGFNLSDTQDLDKHPDIFFIR